MQPDKKETVKKQQSKKQIKEALAKVVKKYRGKEPQMIFATKADLPVAIINIIEKGNKDPNFTTIFRLAESLGLSCSEFVKEIEENLPEDFHFLEK